MPRILLLLLLALLLAAPAGAVQARVDFLSQAGLEASVLTDDDSSPASDKEATSRCHDKHPTVTEWLRPHLREEDAALWGTVPRAPPRVFIALVLPPPR